VNGRQPTAAEDAPCCTQGTVPPAPGSTRAGSRALPGGWPEQQSPLTQRKQLLREVDAGWLQ